MKIAHVIPSVAARDGGPSTSVVSMCRALADCGVDVTLVTTDADGSGRLPVVLGRESDWRGVKTFFFERQWTESLKYSAPLARWLNERVADFDLLHIHGVLSHAPLAAARACQRAQVPYVVRPLGTLDPWSLAQKALKKRLLMSVAGVGMLRGAAAIHCTSDEERRAVEGELRVTSAVTIPLGVEVEFLTAAQVSGAERDANVLVVSRLHPVKNLEAFIEAFADALAAETVAVGGRRWTLTIAGSGDAEYERRLRRVVCDRKLERHVSFAGWVDRQQKLELMRTASMFALPSLHENFGVSLVEALACGLPALVTRQVHLSEIVLNAGAGWSVESDRGSLRDGLLQAWSDVEGRRTAADAARSLARRFAWHNIAGELAALYSTIATRPLASGGPAQAVQPFAGDDLQVTDR